MFRVPVSSYLHPLQTRVSIRKKGAPACNRFTSPFSRRTNMNKTKMGAVVSLAIVFVAYPTGVLFAKKHPRSASPPPKNAAAVNANDPGGHAALGVEAAKKRDYETA